MIITRNNKGCNKYISRFPLSKVLHLLITRSTGTKLAKQSLHQYSVILKT